MKKRNVIHLLIFLASSTIIYNVGFSQGSRSALVASRLDTNTTSSPINTEDTTAEIPKTEDKTGEKFSTLNLPMRYFDYKYLTSWSSCDGDTIPKSPNCYKIASAGNFKGPYAYQSYPSTKITISGYPKLQQIKTENIKPDHFNNTDKKQG